MTMVKFCDKHLRSAEEGRFIVLLIINPFSFLMPSYDLFYRGVPQKYVITIYHYSFRGDDLWAKSIFCQILIIFYFHLSNYRSNKLNVLHNTAVFQYGKIIKMLPFQKP